VARNLRAWPLVHLLAHCSSGTSMGIARKQFKSEVLVFISFLGVVCVEVFVHWLLANNAAPTLTRFYLSESKRNSITALVDNFLPAIILGVVNGWFGWNWSTRKLTLSASFLSIGIVASETLFQLFFRSESLWWWPPTINDINFRLLTTLVFMGLFLSR
jgi:hypothetical protein